MSIIETSITAIGANRVTSNNYVIISTQASIREYLRISLFTFANGSTLFIINLSQIRLIILLQNYT